MKIYLFDSTTTQGRYIYSLLKNSYNIKCINSDIFNVKKDDWSKLNQVLSKLKKEDIIINTLEDIEDIENTEQFQKYTKVNTIFPHKLQHISKKYNCKFIHISTDCVFSGLANNYTENCIHDSETTYAISKSIGEPMEATIIRAFTIGEDKINKKSLLEWIKTNANGSIYGYRTHYWNGITCLTLAKIIKQMIDENIWWKGVRHIYTPHTETKYLLCKYINDIYKLNINIVPIDVEIKYMTLSSIYPRFYKIDKIYDQILEQKNYIFN